MKMMKAVVIERFGDESELSIGSVPVPDIASNEVLIRIEYAGVGSWDVFERQGGYAEMLGIAPTFPYVLGSEGAGEIVAVGDAVTQFARGDRVMASGFLNPKGGFYAEYVAVGEETVAPVPAGYSMVEASAVLGVGITALRGLADVLGLRSNDSLCVFGASGGVGHVAVQLANAIGAEVNAVASGPDGVELVRRLGCNSVFDGRDETDFASLLAAESGKLGNVLLTAGGSRANEVCRLTKAGGVVTFPSGVTPTPVVPEDITCTPYYGEPNREITERLFDTIERHGVKPHVSAVVRGSEAASAHERVVGHHVGKLVLDLRSL